MFAPGADGVLFVRNQNPTHGRDRGLLKQSAATVPMERIAIDILGPLPKTLSGNEYVMVISDYFTKWIECYALPDQQAYTVADALVTKFFTRFVVLYLMLKEKILNLSYFSIFVTYLAFKRHARPHIDINLMAWLNVLIEQFSKCWRHM